MLSAACLSMVYLFNGSREEIRKKIVSYRDLIVWEKGMALAVQIYDLTREFSDSEKFGLVNQLRRAAVSIPSNIAEGFARGSRKEFQQFLRIAKGSTYEIQVQLELSFKIGYINIEFFNSLEIATTEICKMLSALIRSLDSQKHPRSVPLSTEN